MKVRSLQFAWFMVSLLVAGMGFLWWRAKNNKAACEMLTRNVQSAMRSHSGVNIVLTGAPLDKSELVGLGKYIEREPVCPSCGPYQWSPVVPPAGELMIKCSHPDHQLPHAKIKDW